MFKSIIAFTLCIILTSCGNPKIINKIMLVQTLGYDSTGKKVRGSILMGDYRKKGEVSAILSDTVTESELNILPALNAKTKSTIEYGQLGIIVFGKGYSRKGISAVIENLCRETTISTNMQLAVANKSAFELLQAAKIHKDAYLLSDMIEQNMKNGNLPNTNLQKTLNSFYSEGRDPFLPHLSMEHEELKVDGLALFRNAKYVTRVGLEKSLLLKLLLENAKNGTYMVPILIKDGNEGMTLLRILKSKVRYQLTKSGPHPLITFQLSIHAEIRDVPNRAEYHASDLIPQFEDRVGTYMEQELKKLLMLCKKNKVDPLGLEDFVIRNTNNMDAVSSQKDASEFDTDVSVHLDIISQ